MADRWLVIGLGNPGVAYENTRHNIGFTVLDALAKKHRQPLHWTGQLTVQALNCGEKPSL